MITYDRARHYIEEQKNEWEIREFVALVAITTMVIAGFYLFT